MANIEKRLDLYIKNSLFLFFLFLSSAINAAVVEITAIYRPDISNTSHLSFENTTEVSGYCKQDPGLCGDNMFSIIVPELVVTKHLLSGTGSIPENIIALKLDATFRNIKLTNLNNGEQTEASFRINTASYELARVAGGQGVVGGWIDPTLRGGCRKTIGRSADPYWYRTAWTFKEDNTYCYQNLRGTYDSDFIIRNISIGYELEISSPLGLSNGVYVGETTYSLGKGADFDYFTDDYNYTDNEIHFRITATVEHSFHMQFPAGSNRIHLEPSGGWGQWLNYGRTPARLERNVQFALTTSSPVNISLRCQHSVGSQCGLRNTDSGDVVGLETRVTLPALKAADGSNAQETLLTTAAAGQTFSPAQYVYQRNAQVHFRVNKPEVETMLKQPGSRWGGQVTLMFDAGL